jgi:hypothetical protein
MFYHSEKPSSTKLFDTVIRDIDRTQNDMIKHIYITSIQEFDDKFEIIVRKEHDGISLPTYDVAYTFQKKHLNAERIVRIKEEQLKLANKRAEQSEFESLCYQLLYVADHQRVDLVSFKEDYNTVTIVVRRYLMNGPEAITETHSFHKSNLEGEQLRRLEILEWQCKMIRVSAGELSFCNCKAFLEQFARLKEGDRLVIERAEDNNTVWLYMKFHTKARFNYFRSWHCSKELLTKEQLELIRSIPYEAMVKDNDIATDTYWDELLKEDLEHGN